MGSWDQKHAGTTHLISNEESFAQTPECDRSTRNRCTLTHWEHVYTMHAPARTGGHTRIQLNIQKTWTTTIPIDEIDSPPSPNLQILILMCLRAGTRTREHALFIAVEVGRCAGGGGGGGCGRHN